jgi:RNA-binding protein
MKLTEPQKKHLRGLAHHLAPCVHVGNAGVTPALLAELEGALAHHELLKVKVRTTDREQRNALIAELTDRSGAILVTRIGNVAVLYRPDASGPRLTLPGQVPA